MCAPSPQFRLLEPTDSLVELTRLLNDAYRELLDQGLRYVATWQDEDVTARRIRHAECWVVEEEGELVATLTLYPPGTGHGHEVYRRTGVAKIGQFGVRPDRKGRGLGSALLDRVEARAREIGATAIAGDTAEPARHLVAFYERRGYRVEGRAKWDTVNYESLVLVKSLAPSDARTTPPQRSGSGTVGALPTSSPGLDHARAATMRDAGDPAGGAVKMDDHELDALLDRLSSASLEERVAAARQLATSGEPRAVRPLLRHAEALCAFCRTARQPRYYPLLTEAGQQLEQLVSATAGEVDNALLDELSSLRLEIPQGTGVRMPPRRFEPPRLRSLVALERTRRSRSSQ